MWMGATRVSSKSRRSYQIWTSKTMDQSWNSMKFPCSAGSMFGSWSARFNMAETCQRMQPLNLYVFHSLDWGWYFDAASSFDVRRLQVASVFCWASCLTAMLTHVRLESVPPLWSCSNVLFTKYFSGSWFYVAFCCFKKRLWMIPSLEWTWGNWRG